MNNRDTTLLSLCEYKKKQNFRKNQIGPKVHIFLSTFSKY